MTHDDAVDAVPPKVARIWLMMRIRGPWWARVAPPFLANMVLVALVAFQTWTVSHDQLSRATVVQFAVGGAWAFNVRSLANGGWPERIGYMAGGSCGVAIGILAARALR